jgi:uncharacterized protein YutE (UPF0331/DUF86 family)
VLSAGDDTVILGDWRLLGALKWHLLLAIEDAFSLCQQVVAGIGGTAPSAYAECFESLQQLGIIDQSLSERLRAMARFRNLLLHRYWEVDDQRVLTIARNDLGDLEMLIGALDTRFNLGV